MASRISDCVRDANKLSSSLMARWSALASRSAAKIDAGAYDASSAAQDSIAGTALAAEGAWLWSARWWKELANLGGFEGRLGEQPNTARSQRFPAPAGAKLEFDGPLLRGPGLEALAGVSIHTEQTKADGDGFHLGFDGSQCRAGTYVGKVKATTDAGVEEAVFVWISVP